VWMPWPSVVRYQETKGACCPVAEGFLRAPELRRTRTMKMG
jgi:hypothetical protein